MTLTTTALTIGPLRVIIEATDLTIHAALRSAYQAFAAEAVPVSHTLTARVNYTRGPAPVEWPFTFDRGVLRFTAKHYIGTIDVIDVNAQLNFTAPHPFEPIDYFVRAALALLAFEAGGLLFHAAGLVRRGRGYAFFGHSGSGKTTVARVSSDAVILNDDLIVLLPQASHPAACRTQAPPEPGGTPGRQTREADRWLMAATPFSHPRQATPAGPQSASLQALYRLVQDRRVFLKPIEPAVALAEVIANSPIVNADPDRALALLARAEQLVNTVPMQRLHFLPDDSFWALIQP